MAIEKDTCDKVNYFVELARLAKPENQEKFNMEVISASGEADLSLRFEDALLYENLSCPQTQVDSIAESVMQYKGSLTATEDSGPDHLTARRLQAMKQIEGHCFSDENRSAAAEIFNKMFKAGTTAADIEKYSSQLVALDGRFKRYRYIFNKYSALGETGRAQPSLLGPRLKFNRMCAAF